MNLEIEKIKKSWENYKSNLKEGNCINHDWETIYKEIEQTEIQYITLEGTLKVKSLKAEQIISANHSLCCKKEQILELINILSSFLNCEPTSQTNPNVQITILDKLARAGGVSIRPFKQGSYSYVTNR